MLYCGEYLYLFVMFSMYGEVTRTETRIARMYWCQLVLLNCDFVGKISVEMFLPPLSFKYFRCKGWENVIVENSQVLGLQTKFCF